MNVRLLTVSLLSALSALGGCGGSLAVYDKPGPGGDVDPQDTGVVGDDDDDSDADTDTDSDTDTDPPQGFVPEVDGVTPDFGTNAGGTIIEVTGSFDAATDVFVGGEAARIVDFSSSRLEVEVPPSGSAGWVDVRAESAGGDGELDRAFQYFEDGAGQGGTIGAVGYTRYQGNYWDVPNPPPYAWGTVAFTEPSSWEVWKDYTPSMGSCAFDYVSAVNITTMDPGASTLDLGFGARTLGLADASGTFGAGWYSSSLVADTDVAAGNVYDFDALAGNADWPSFSVQNAVRMPGQIRVTRPNLDANQLPSLNRQLTLEWTGAAADYVLISLLRVDPQGNAAGAVSCAVPDTGQFTVPSNSWPQWPVGLIVYVDVGRVKVQRNTLPHDDSENRVAGVYWTRGAGVSD